MKLVLEFPDAERLVRAYLAGRLPDYIDLAGVDTADDDTPFVRVGVPGDWTIDESDPFIQVACDGTPRVQNSLAADATIRLVAWSSSTSLSKALVSKAHAVLCAHPGGDGISNVRHLTGLLPGRDSATKAELASMTARVVIRSTRLEPLGS